MRRENSTFKTGFISEEGNELRNNDYFAYVELDDYACYAIADGISNFVDSVSARAAVEYIITKFQEEPSMSKKALQRYLEYANNKLRRRNTYEREKASVTVVVTNYNSMRYGHAGNTRLRLYHEGKLKSFSSDMSLSQDLADRDKIPRNAVERHQHRNNLYTCLGHVNFQPFISKKIKLAAGDIIALYTKGIWENLGTAELDDAVSDATDDPAALLNNVEDMVLSKQPDELDNYTMAAIFVDQIFEDPNRRRKIKRIILISVIVAVIIIVIIVLAVFLSKRKAKYTEELNSRYSNTVEYMIDSNFVRAKEECELALEAAEKVKDKDMIARLNEYMLVLDAIIQGDDSYDEENFESAKESYQKAQKRMRYADNIGSDYVEQKLGKVEKYIAIDDSMAMGASLEEMDDLDGAEKEYLNAKELAISLYDTDRKDAALAALEALYAKQQEAAEAAAAEAEDNSGTEITAAEFVAKGDEAVNNADYSGAVLYYTQALEKYQELEDDAKTKAVQKKLDAATAKSGEVDSQTVQAEAYEQEGKKFQEAENYYSAKTQYLLAKNIYAQLGNDSKVSEIEGIIAVLDSCIEQ